MSRIDTRLMAWIALLSLLIIIPICTVKFIKKHKPELIFATFGVCAYAITGWIDGGIMAWIELLSALTLIVFLTVLLLREYIRERNLLRCSIEVIDRMSGIEFEEWLLVFCKHIGYKGKATPRTNDYGADLILRAGKRTIVIQAKRWKNDVGIDAVRQVIGAMDYYKASTGVVVITSEFTESARSQAKASGIILIDRKRLIEMIKKYTSKIPK